MEERTARSIPNVLSIAGVDPSGGAGLLADVKTMSSLGAYACGVVTALTAQSTKTVSGILDVPPAFITEQLETLFDDVRIDAAKIGMLSRPETIRAVAESLRKHRPRYIVLDPVITAKSGAALLGADAVGTLKEELLPLCDVFTPNLPEAMTLLGEEALPGADEMPEVARRLFELAGGRAAVYLKGGHLEGERMRDVIFDGREMRSLESVRFDTKNTHGTGCALSSALAALLPQCADKWEAVVRAHDWLQQAIRDSGNLSVGTGHGPVDHFWQHR